jgi:hypothetical protein
MSGSVFLQLILEGCKQAMFFFFQLQQSQQAYWSTVKSWQLENVGSKNGLIPNYSLSKRCIQRSLLFSSWNQYFNGTRLEHIHRMP